MANAPRKRNLRRAKPLEREIQAGVLALLRLMPEVAWAHKVPVGEGVIIRPLSGGSVRAQLQPAINLRILKQSQLGYMKGAPEGVLDIALQLTGIGTHCELEVKQPGQYPTVAQRDRMTEVRDNGGFADWVDDIEMVQPLIEMWRKQS